MYITPVEYLNLSERLTSFQAMCEQLRQQNKKLKDKTIVLQQTITILNEEKQMLHSKEKQAKIRLFDHISRSSNLIKDHVQLTSQEEKKFIEKRMVELSQNSTAQKLKTLQVKMQENRILYDQYIQFYGKIKTLYHSCSKKKESPSIQNLYKWVEQGRSNQIVANDMSKGIFEFILGVAPPKKSSNNLKSSTIKLSSKNVLTTTKKINLNESSVGKNTKSNIKKQPQVRNSTSKNLSNKKQDQNLAKRNQEKPTLSGMNFIMGLQAAAAAKKAQQSNPVQTSGIIQTSNQDALQDNTYDILQMSI